MMITTHEISSKEDVEPLRAALRAARVPAADVAEAVLEIIGQVESGGDGALAELTERLDGVRVAPGSLEVGPQARDEALRLLDAPVREALEKAAARIKAFAEIGLPADFQTSPAPGITTGTVSRPMDTVGIYVPGGRYPYPSTVLMTGIPARAAGVSELVLCVPPGKVNPATLAATAMLGDCRVFTAGGAQAIAAMAFGTETVPACEMIAGPGNIYVSTAKRLVSDRVRVDLDAGPSEVVIYADASTPPAFAAMDLLAQLEHDPLALAVLVSEQAETLEAVRLVLGGEPLAPEGTVDLVLSEDRALSLELINAVAPEHLELAVDEAASLLPSIKKAGCVFLGQWSAVALGDYVAGPSHVLPTGGSAARLSGLSARDFMRTMNVISYTKEGLAADARYASGLAALEGLTYHARSVETRDKGPAADLEV